MRDIALQDTPGRTAPTPAARFTNSTKATPRPESENHDKAGGLTRDDIIAIALSGLLLIAIVVLAVVKPG